MRLIDADEVIEEINNIISNIAFTSPYQNDIPVMTSGMERVLSVVEDAPTIEAKPVVHGEWDFIGDYDSRCSVCGEEYCIGPNEDYNFCPNCGADMRERKET